MRRLWITAVCLSVCLSAPARQNESWVGQTILTKRGGVKFEPIGPMTEGQVRTGTLSLADYKVEAEDADRVRVRQNGVAGWVNKADIVPLSGAVEYFTGQIRQQPNSENHNHRAWAYKLHGDLDAAIAGFGEAIRLDPNNFVAFNNRGDAWVDKHQYDKAIADFDAAIRLEPRYALAFNGRGVARRAKHEHDKAIADLSEAIRLEPNYLFAYSNRGVAWTEKKQYDRAIADFTEAIRLDPSYVAAFNARAWLWATCPDERYRDGGRAIESATRACELTGWKDPGTIDTLAAAYAEAGRFNDAVKCQERAMTFPEYANANGKDALQRLKLYRDRKAYRGE